MVKVARYTQDDEAKVVAFIRRAQANADPDKSILSRSVLIKDDQQVVGMVSYEPHDNMGVIRYFLYDARIAGIDLMVGMFLELYKKAQNEGVKQLIAQAPSREVEQLFEMLGFFLINASSVLPHLGGKNAQVLMIGLEESGD